MINRWQTGRATILVGLAALALAGCATQAQKSAGEALDDTVIASTVKSKLIGTKGVSANDINVEVYKGQVQLAGFVGSESAKRLAIDAARSVAGVTDVSDAMIIFTESRSAGEVIDDGVIAGKVKTAVAQAEPGKSLDVNVEVRKSNVLLSGFVPSAEAKARAGDAASAIEDVDNVYNEIDVTK
ncbi:MAG TPA: BON domain-containing protein [Steroidobacteraceae bacterium]|nr:BON domain-containing protein [Steroidobacteraceae bacterium]